MLEKKQEHSHTDLGIFLATLHVADVRSHVFAWYVLELLMRFVHCWCSFCKKVGLY